MKKNEAKQKLGVYLLVLVFLLLAILCFAEGLYCDGREMGFLPTMMKALGGFSAIMAIFYAYLSWVAHKKFKKMYDELPTLLENYKRVREELEKMGFNSEQHISALGYEFAEYRDDFGAPDNSHIEIDKTNRSLAIYRLRPFAFAIYKFEEISSVNIFTVVSGIYFAGVEIRLVDKSGNEFAINVADGGCNMGSTQQVTASANAKKLADMLRELLGVGGTNI